VSLFDFLRPQKANPEGDDSKPMPPEKVQHYPFGSALSDELARALIEYGVTNDEAKIKELSAVYMRAVECLANGTRLEMLNWVLWEVEQRKLSVNAVLPFIFRETAPLIVTSAALHAAVYWAMDDDPLSGVKELAAHATEHITGGDPKRAAAILSGLILLGDRRVTEFVGPCWRWFPPADRHYFVSLLGVAVYAPVVEWVLDWLEQCEGGEFGNVASLLARLFEGEPPAEVLEVRRGMPFWKYTDQPVEIIKRWAFEEYVEQLRPRLLQIAANEAAPRVMHDVLKRWGIDFSRRHIPGIVMLPERQSHDKRDLLPLLPPGSASVSGVFDVVPLADGDFLARDGRLLLCWAIFNPFGPTWSCLGAIPSEDPAVDILFYRMLNPFLQQSGAVGTLRASDRKSGPSISRMVCSLFERNGLGGGQDGAFTLVRPRSAPTLVLIPWEDLTFQSQAPVFFQRSPAIIASDLADDLHYLRAFGGRPWDREKARVDRGLAQLRDAGLLALPESGAAVTQEEWSRQFAHMGSQQSGAAVTPAVLTEWLDLVCSPEHVRSELVCYPAAWHGAIDHADEPLAATAFTFYQLDDFLSRYGLPVFREIADASLKVRENDQRRTSRSTIRFLLVEDEEVLARLFGRFLEQTYQGAEVRYAKGNSEAFEVLESFTPTLITTDFHHCDGTGVDLLRRLRTDLRTCGVPVVMISASASGEERVLSYHATGFDAVLSKPCDLSKLMETINRLLNLGSDPESADA